MGKGQRHSKNAGVMGAEGLSYAERRALGYGTVKERLGKDSLGNYYDCCLTLQPAVDPVMTPDGYLFSKEAILENLLAQKKAIKRKMAAWEASQQMEHKKATEKALVEQQADLIAFDRVNHMGISKQTADSIKVEGSGPYVTHHTFASMDVEAKVAIESEAAQAGQPGAASSVMNIKENEERVRQLKAFWMPSQGPSAKVLVEKPDPDTYCPASGKKLKMKELVPVKFTPVGEGDSGLHMDPLTKDTLTNASKLVLLKNTGEVLLKETYVKLVKPEGSYNGKRVKESDVIEFQTGGTGFAQRGGEKVQSTKYAQVGVGSGRQDLRGQHQGPRSMGGLQFLN